ncbi:MAG: AraC family transcriptional regulator [Proteobacteria bacterium]|nr:AraC family transcriptional regulator [Pseudomonadota bacterium]
MLRSRTPTVSVRVIRPFAAVLSRCVGVPDDFRWFKIEDPDDRISIQQAITNVHEAIEISGDPNIGLRAATELTKGDFDLLEYTAVSSATPRAAIPVLRRYFRLISEASDLDLIEIDGQALIRMTHAVGLPRAIIDFQSAVYNLAVERWMRPNRLHKEAWFAHSEPPDTRVYREVFGELPLRFRAPFDGFLLDRDCLDRPLATADPKLHKLLCEFAEQRVAEFAAAKPFSHQVAELIAQELAGGRPSADSIASRLKMTRRTLSRRLDQEGPSFQCLVDTTLFALARFHIALGERSIGEIASMLGFSEPAAFYRAFKRWSGRTPSAYRRTHTVAMATPGTVPLSKTGS